MKKLVIGMMILSFVLPVWGQSLEGTLEELAKENAKGYLGPVVTAFGTGVNSGTFRTAKSHKLLGFDVTVNVSATTVSDEGLEYDFYIPDQVTLPFNVTDTTSYDIVFDGDSLFPGDRTSSTFFGEQESHSISPDGSYASNEIKDQLVNTYGVNQLVVDNIPDSEIITSVNELIIKTPQGFNISALPMVIPQVSVGLPLDIEITLRGFPPTELPDDAGKLSFFGFGGKIGLNQFIPIPLFPVDLAAGWYSTNLTIGDILDASNSILTFQASKSIPFITVYGGIGIESSSLDVSYDAILDPNNPSEVTPIGFSLEGNNTFRTIVGLRLKLLLLSINADYSVGEFNSFNLGVGFSLR